MRTTLPRLRAPLLLLLALATLPAAPRHSASAQSGRQPKDEKKSEKPAQTQDPPLLKTLLKRMTTR
ncbi:MAG TPA: hypothetical protein VF621_04150, partial [Pyrinomonadaceae bacterium]